MVNEELGTLRIVHDPFDAVREAEPDLSHAEMVGLPRGDSEQAELDGDLISECIRQLHPAMDVD